MNIISGGLSPSAGTILADGKECHFSCSKDGRKAGIAFVHQELSLMREMTAGENIMLGMEPRRGGWIDQKKLHEQASAVLEEIGYDIDAYELVRNLSPAQRQIVEIAKAWAASPRVLIFDEPTRGIDVGAKVEIYNLMNKLKQEGIAVMFVSSELPEVLGIADRVIVMCDGRITGEVMARETTQNEVLKYATEFEKKQVG